MTLQRLPMPDTFFFSNNVSVAGSVDLDLQWSAIAAPVTRGKGTTVPPDDWAAFEGEFAEASCHGRIGGRETGFQFNSGLLTEDGFFAQLGPERNGVYLTAP